MAQSKHNECSSLPGGLGQAPDGPSAAEIQLFKFERDARFLKGSQQLRVSTLNIRVATHRCASKSFAPSSQPQGLSLMDIAELNKVLQSAEGF